MSKLMEMNDVKIPTSRSGFDMSSKICYTAKTGELLPLLVQEYIPSEKKKIKLSHYTRTMPINSAAYTRIREYFDFFFVPYTQLWKQWKMFATQMDSNSTFAKSINDPQLVSDTHPYFTFKQVADHIYKFRNGNNLLGYNTGKTSVKLLEYLGYGNFPIIWKNSIQVTTVMVKSMLTPLIFL